jgi:transcriptional regulator with XRE-family HTH domain
MSIDLYKIGQFLKEKREEKGLTIVEISNVLYLRKSLIEAIESGNWDVLPHPVYVKGYIKEYASLLKVYDEIAHDLVEENNAVVIDVPVQQKSEPKRKKLSKTILLYPVTIALIITVFFIFNKTQNNQTPTIKLGNATGHVSVSSYNNNGVDKKNIPNIPDVKRLMITCHERTWISVVIDETEKKEFMLNPQEIIMLNAKEKFDLLIGNAGGVKLFLNGKDIEFTGKNGEVKRIKLS